MKNVYILTLFVLVSITFSGCVNKAATDKSLTKTAEVKRAKTNDGSQMSSVEVVADRLEIYYFHSTARCNSCKTIGRFVKETIEQKYAKEVKSGRIDYREINVDLPENKELATKYQASGSSLFINRIKEEQENIELDVNVWRLLGDETRFKSYLENKINSYLGV